jgi:superfamily II DNA or RNA helicase
MKIGDQVTCKIHPEYKVGKIIEINPVGDSNFCEVFFKEIKDFLTLDETSLIKFTSSVEKIESNDYDNPLLFSLSFLAEKINSLNYQDKIISVNNFNIFPLPHQILTVNRALEEFEPRFLIADEVGLGKTIEAALVFEELKLRNMCKRVLIVCPSGLTNQWKDELKTKFNEEFIVMNREAFKGLSSVHGVKNIWLEYDQVITSMDFVKPRIVKDSLSDKTKENRNRHNKQVYENLIDGNWDMVIVDEAHHLSKDIDLSETSRYKLGYELANNTPILLLLTATPHQGKSERFRYLLELIDPYKFFDSDSLNTENIESVTIKNEKRAVVDLEGNLIFKDRIVNLVKISRDENNIESLLYKKVSDYVAYYHYIARKSPIVMFILLTYQRMVSSSTRAIFHSMEKRLTLLKNNSKSLEDLKVTDFDEIEDEETQEKYDNIMKYVGSETDINDVNFNQLKPHVIKEMAMLEDCLNFAKKASTGRQDIKIEKLLSIIDEVIARDGLETKFIIFTEFIKTQGYIGEILEEFGYNVAYLNGKMSLDDKISNKTKFKENHQFLVSTDTGGEGVNLQFAHVMINYDLPWNPMKIEQRIGRIDRIGQDKNVFVFNFVLEDTAEEQVRDILDSKLDLIADEFGDDKKSDVLTLLNDEYDFDKIYMESIKARKVKENELKIIADNIYSQAKDIIESQQLLIPFNEEKNLSNKVEDYLIEDESILIENLIKYYLEYIGLQLIEYSKDKNVYYIDKPIDNVKYRNLVFDKKISLENERYDYLNLSHPLVKKILDELLSNDSLAFDLKITNYSENIKGTLFLYDLKITNNEDFKRKYLIPIFIDENNTFNEKVSDWFERNIDFKIKMDFREDKHENLDEIQSKVDELKMKKLKNT